MQNSASETQAFPFFKKENLTKEAFITLTNDPTQAPLEMTSSEMKMFILQGALSNYDSLYNQCFNDSIQCPLVNKAKQLKKQAESYLSQVKTEYPDKHFILKKTSSNQELWEICFFHNIFVIDDDSYLQKLVNTQEVTQKGLQQYSLNFHERGTKEVHWLRFD